MVVVGGAGGGRRFAAEGEFCFGLGRSGSGDGEFERPTGVAVDQDGDIYVCDYGNDRVQLFSAEGRYVEQFIGDYGLEHGLKLHPAGPDTGKKVAIVGSGPAGLACAYQLRRKGHACTLFESHGELGGMMRSAFPATASRATSWTARFSAFSTSAWRCAPTPGSAST